MDVFPLEVWGDVCKALADDDYASRRAIGNLRAAIPALDAVLAPYLFEIVPLWLGPGCLRTLTDVSLQPNL